jgi:hypothetical protein
MADKLIEVVRRLPVVDFELAQMLRLRSHAYTLADRINNGEVTPELVRDVRDTSDKIKQLTQKLERADED